MNNLNRPVRRSLRIKNKQSPPRDHTSRRCKFKGSVKAAVRAPLSQTKKRKKEVKVRRVIRVRRALMIKTRITMSLKRRSGRTAWQPRKSKCRKSLAKSEDPKANSNFN